jgi:hypothetical protein
VLITCCAAHLLRVAEFFSQVRGVWEAEASCLLPLITASAHASSTDNEQQTMGAYMQQ